ncbi:Ubiquitinyl hydrolase 1 [Handroanthus impetiginosus]|uniref:Ubiquitinyl hydrolase 1 n=1 Tax=Handroanthus impetiginosus TaxID=429701 RepID=A0A2G9GV76_9LAMI|nr:Ubiquitinyl hydrolase 1 [Handroanthus impetiginosus]
MGHCCILIPRPRDEEVCRGRRKSEEIPQRLYCWVDAQKLIEFSRLDQWGEYKLPNKVHDAEDHLKSIMAEIVMIYRLVFEFNPISQELYLLNPDSAVTAIVKAKDQEIKELKKRNLSVLAPVKADAAATEEQCHCGAACEEWDDNDGEEKERKDEEEEDEEDEEMNEERKDDEDEDEEEKVEEDKQKKEKIEKGQDDKKGENEDGEDEEGKEKECEKEEKRKDGDDDEERDHDADNEYNDMNEKN